MGHTNTIEKAAGAYNTNDLHTDTNTVDFRTADASQQADDGKAIATIDEFTLIVSATEPRVSTHLLAKHLGNTHRPVIALIDKYLDSFKSFGHVTFKKADGDRKQGGGKTERYALLNEDQAHFLLSLSRNSDIVVNLKVKLIKAFSLARKAADLRKFEYLPGHHQLHDALHVLSVGSPNERHVHINVNRLLNKFAGLDSGQRASAAVPQQAMLIVGQAMATRAAQGATDHHDGYQRIKTTLQALGAVTGLGALQ